ncbi:aminoacyl-tRNA deacylase [Gorillibacterium sp. sgz500922]|uniref:aminoacyl-tRNA deacylase n=1 Tax=Gorillibacterium sp. sgz500922 TaxID=3446694 RepID=UPI003F66299F
MKNIAEILDAHQVEYEIIRHEIPIETARQGAEYLGIEIGRTAPTLIVKTDKGYYALLLSGDRGRVQLEQLKPLLQAEQVKLAKPREVEQAVGCSIGCVPLLNPGLPTVFDRGLLRFPHIYGGTGRPGETLKIRPQDAERLNTVAAYL